MKTLFSILLVTFMLCLFQANSARATGEAWVTTEPWAAVYSVHADGAGGCAVLAIHTSGYYRVVWYDKKGGIIWSTNLTAAVSYGFYAVTPKYIVYQMLGGVPPYQVVKVDVKGVSTAINDASFYVGMPTPSGPFMPEVYFDKKGWFAVRLDIATGNQSLARYNYK